MTEQKPQKQEYAQFGKVELPKAVDTKNAPNLDNFAHYQEGDFEIDLQEQIATAWLLNEPILQEGGTALGKSETPKKMAADLGYECYSITCTPEMTSENVTGGPEINLSEDEKDKRRFKFVNGPLLEAVKSVNENPGRVAVINFSEINMRGEETDAYFHDILDAYKNGQPLTIKGMNGQSVIIPKDKIKLVFSMNEPSARFPGTRKLGDPFIRRLVYQKNVETLPEDVLDNNLDVLFGLKNPREVGRKRRKIESRRQMLTDEELKQIPRLKELLNAYRTYHISVRQLLNSTNYENRIGKDQPQKFDFNDREEPRRVTLYFRYFYNGDAVKTLQDALRYFYLGKLSPESADRPTVENLIQTVDYNSNTANQTARPALKTTTKPPVASGSPSGVAAAAAGAAAAAEAWAKKGKVAEIDKTFGVEPGKEKEIHPLEIKPLTKEEAIKAYKESGGKTWVWPELEKSFAYTTPITKNLNVKILNITDAETRKSSDKIIEYMKSQKLRPLTFEELIQFSIQYPKFQEKKPLISLDKKSSSSGGFCAPFVRFGWEWALPECRCLGRWVG